ncbi:segregation and condensation protein A [Clostridia bacterium]|nr:segregation and condensation protein A [Clostridia bacterium]GHU75505.1 segregation and condensation protein A [Clostridia bacterium]
MDDMILKTGDFEGPLELLFYLINKNEMDIYDIRISELTEQYMSYLEDMDVETADMDYMSRFVLMAATLLEIKSALMLPKSAPNNDGKEEDPRAVLVEMLVQYKQFKEIADKLRDGYENNKYQVTREVPEKVAVVVKPALGEVLHGICLQNLAFAFSDVMRRKPAQVQEILERRVILDVFTVEGKLDFLKNFLQKFRKFLFAETLHESAGREETAVTFVAVLELAKLREIDIAQEINFGEISIQAV